VGKFISGVFGGPVNIWAGDLFVEYEVELSVPQLALEPAGAPTTEAEMTFIAPGETTYGMSLKYPLSSYSNTTDTVVPVWNGLPETLSFQQSATNGHDNCLLARENVEFDMDLWSITDTLTPPSGALPGIVTPELMDTQAVSPVWVPTPAGSGAIGLAGSSAPIIDPSYWRIGLQIATLHTVIVFTRITVKLLQAHAIRFLNSVGVDLPSCITHLSTHVTTGLRAPIVELLGRNGPLDLATLAKFVPAPILLRLEEINNKAKAYQLADSVVGKSASAESSKPAPANYRR